MKKKNLLCIFIFLIICVYNDSLAQKPQIKVDSILNLIKTYHNKCINLCIGDSIKVKYLNLLAQEISKNNPDTGLNYSNQALNIANAINWDLGIGQSLNQIGIFYSMKNDLASSLKYYLRAMNEWQIIEKKVSTNTLPFIKTKEAGTLGNIGIIYMKQNDYTAALTYFFKSLKQRMPQDLEGISSNYTNIGIVYAKQNNYSTAIDYHFKAFKINEKLGNKTAIAKSLGNIGNLFWLQNDYAKALEYYQRSLSIQTQIDDKSGQSVTLSNIGSILNMQNKFLEALDYYLKALEIDKAISNKGEVARLLNDIGTIYEVEKKYQIALDYSYQGLEMAKQLGMKDEIATALANIGSLLRLTGKYSEAEKDLSEAKSIADELNDISLQKDIEHYYSDLYFETGDYQKALVHYKLSMIAKDSLFNQQRTKEITTNELNYQFSKKQDSTKAAYDKQMALEEANKQIAVAKAEYERALAEKQKADAENKRIIAQADQQKTITETNKQIAVAAADKKRAMAEADKKIAISNIETQKQKLIRNSVIGSTAGVVLIGFLGFRNFRNKRRSEKAELSQQVSVTEMKALRSQMNPHFIFNALQSIQTFLLSHQSEEANTYLLKFSKLMRLVLENSQYSEVSLKDDIQALELYMQLESIRLQHPFTYQFHIDENIDIENDTIPPLILQPFVENAIWHGLQYKPEPGHINIYLSKKDNALHAIVEDNGVGRNMSKQVAQPMLIKKESLGMKLTEERLKVLNEVKKTKAQFSITDLFAKNNEAAGTRVQLLLPLAT
jgi:tetratricopeptide (TPR) repeat protein